MIYTSYYAKVKKLDPKTNAFVQVSVSKPDWFPQTFQLKEVYPNWRIVSDFKRGLITWEQYTASYYEQLSHVDKREVQDTLRDLECVYQNIYLLCWEAKDPCHRFLLSKWLEMGIQEY